MDKPLTLVAISGSLRKDSLNTAVLRGLGALAPDGVTVKVLDYRDVPVYDQDLGEVAAVEALKKEVAAADAVVIATPEYNYSVPGPLKNLLDWLSRPAYQSVFKHKPTTILSVSPGPIGGARAQQHLKAVLLGMLVEVLPYPEICIGMGNERIKDGEIVDSGTRGLLKEQLEALVAKVRG